MEIRFDKSHILTNRILVLFLYLCRVMDDDPFFFTLTFIYSLFVLFATSNKQKNQSNFVMKIQSIKSLNKKKHFHLYTSGWLLKHYDRIIVRECCITW